MEIFKTKIPLEHELLVRTCTEAVCMSIRLVVNFYADAEILDNNLNIISVKNTVFDPELPIYYGMMEINESIKEFGIITHGKYSYGLKSKYALILNKLKKRTNNPKLQVLYEHLYYNMSKLISSDKYYKSAILFIPHGKIYVKMYTITIKHKFKLHNYYTDRKPETCTVCNFPCFMKSVGTGNFLCANCNPTYKRPIEFYRGRLQKKYVVYYIGLSRSLEVTGLLPAVSLEYLLRIYNYTDKSRSMDNEKNKIKLLTRELNGIIEVIPSSKNDHT